MVLSLTLTHMQSALTLYSFFCNTHTHIQQLKIVNLNMITNLLLIIRTHSFLPTLSLQTLSRPNSLTYKELND